MNIEESVKIVNLLHNAYPQDKKATRSDLFPACRDLSHCFR